VSLKAAKTRVGHRVCLMGNLHPVELLWRGSPAGVASAAALAIADTSGRGFILGSGCEVPVGTPRENIKTMIQAPGANECRSKGFLEGAEMAGGVAPQRSGVQKDDPAVPNSSG
jgi:hypothetical protein